ncbi:Aste57867_10112 [Aphanomyces stellatus]|uniref:Aste57867_10112 protein n=1 Tax=Aphanomyces stellatus TaxID=120398 RepID=A0A485KPL9_9STRA|nr:hypothetical protein As57867_010073 [Aphanomyces stellatus]VFT86988.1 Aste57867_10112 [Aphanomyces stellatus]
MPLQVLIVSKIPQLTEKVQAALATAAPVGLEEGVKLVPVDPTSLTHPLDEATLALLANARVILGDPRTVVRLLPHAPKLEWMQSTFAGVEAILLQPRRDFVLTRAGGIMGLHMAQYVLGWIISKERMFHLAPHYQAKKEFRAVEMRYRHFEHVTIGILGLGDIGTTIGQLVAAAGFRVLGLKRSSVSASDSTDRFRVTSDMHALLAESDYIVNVLPSTDATIDLLSGDVLQACKAKAPCLINVGRGDVVDEASLVRALDRGWLASAVLDVFAVEPLPAQSELWAHPKVTVTPHVAALSMPEDVASVFVRNVAQFQAKSAFEYVFDWAKGY